MSYKQLTLEERYVIYHLRVSDLSIREIARRLGRHHSTISRELKRNRPPAASHWVYFHEVAHQFALARRKQARHHRRRGHAPLVDYVEQGLRSHYSPDVIAARITMQYPSDVQMRVSIETIYRWVYRDAADGGQLFRCLCRGHKKRRRQRRYGSGRGLIPGRVSIHDRPELVGTRHRYGDWEGDTVEGAKGTGQITTHVERKSRYLIAARLDDKTARETADAVSRLFRRIPRSCRHTLTLDNGKEFARFGDIEKRTGLSVYFADPYSAWQRGANENTNGLLRRYFPKGSDFSKISDKELAAVVKRINHRPRKCLGYRSPHEVFQEAKRGAVGM
ncbi:MAG: IS30 family transposase [Rhodocyclaceae bacterium]|nr:IS30 family transposase [Rhodocyclaceae bacterium]